MRHDSIPGQILLAFLRRCPLSYGKCALARWISLPDSPLPLTFTTPAGLTFNLDLREHQMRQIFLYGWYEENTVRNLSRFLRPGMTFVDVGANVGQYSLFANRHVGETGKVFAFEPSPRALKFLRENIVLNRAERIVVEEMALSDIPGSASLKVPRSPDNVGLASLWAGNPADVDSVSVSVTTLDEYFGSRGLSIDVLKLDAECAEAHVLRGAASLLKPGRPMVVVCELGDDGLRRAGSSSQEVFEFMRSRGFHACAPRGVPGLMTKLDAAAPSAWFDNVFFIGT